jgi:hypothetical protein
LTAFVHTSNNGSKLIILRLVIFRTLYVAIMALCLNGVAISGQQVAGVVDALHEATLSGFPDSPDTHGVVSGVWNSLSGGGRFISRCLAGILVDSIGFRDSTTIIVALQGSIALVALIYSLINLSRTRRREKEEDEEKELKKKKHKQQQQHAKEVAVQAQLAIAAAAVKPVEEPPATARVIIPPSATQRRRRASTLTKSYESSFTTSYEI